MVQSISTWQVDLAYKIREEASIPDSMDVPPSPSLALKFIGSEREQNYTTSLHASSFGTAPQLQEKSQAEGLNYDLFLSPPALNC